LGYSALWYTDALPEDGVIETVERDEIRANLAEDNFLNAGRSGQVGVLRGEAMTILPELDGPYDLISVDTDWSEFPLLFNEILCLVRVGGIITSSNLFPRTFDVNLGGISEVA